MTDRYLFYPIVTARQDYSVALADPRENLGRVRLHDGRWYGHLGYAIELDLGAQTSKEDAAAVLEAERANYHLVELFKALGGDPATVDAARELLQKVPGSATITYGECGGHEVAIEWMAAP